jgi:magnesium transporter
MLRAYVTEQDRLNQVADLASAVDRVVWVDLLEPTKEEQAAVEQWIGLGVPTREEMEEIEVSSRLFTENSAHFMTIILPALMDQEVHVMGPVSFVLSGRRLVTIRYHDPRAFRIFPQRASKADLGCIDGQHILVALLEAIVDRVADLLERASRDVVDLSHEIFQPRETKASKRDQSFQAILRRIGRKEEFVSNVHDSLVTMQRLAGFFGHVALLESASKDMRDRIKTLSRDLSSLTEHAASLSAKITFLLDATLGMINIEQNAIIKIVSVAAVVFLPPTLIASVYGMNFETMPELQWDYGYPMAVVLMIVAAVLPFLWFKRRGWL